MQKSEQDLMNEANGLFNAGEYGQAEKLYAAAREEEPDNPQLCFLLGMCRERQKDPAGGLEYLRQAVELGDDMPLFHFHLGRLCLTQGLEEEGREQLAQSIALNPNFAEARTLLGNSWFQAGDLDRAENELRSAHRSNPDYAPAMSALALILLEKGELDEAANQAGEASRKLPDDPGTQIVLGQVLRAQGHLDFAEQCWRNALEKHPDHPGLKGGLARTLLEAGRAEEALPLFREVVRKPGVTSRLLLDFATCLNQLGHYREVIRIFTPFREHTPDNTGLNHVLAHAHFHAGEPAQAAEILAATPQREASDTLLLGRALRAAGRTEEAAQALGELVDHEDPEVAGPARLEAGQALLAEGRSEQAREYLEPLIHGQPPVPEAVLAWVDHLDQQGDMEKACQVLDDVLAGDPGPAAEVRSRLRNRLARLHDRRGDHQAAAGQLESGGWLSAGFLPALTSDEARSISDAWMEAGAEDFADFPIAAGDDRPAVIWALGWPGSGRDLLVRALGAHPGTATLEPERWQARRGSLAMPATPELIRQRDETSWQLDRRKYYRKTGVVDTGAILLDPMWCNVLDLPGLARTFPDARVVVMGAEEADLHLHWTLAGFERPMEMVQAFRREQKLFRHLATHLPLGFKVVSRARLLGDRSTQTLRELTDWLGLEWDDRVARQLESDRGVYEHWPDGHWHNYAAMLGRD